MLRSGSSHGRLRLIALLVAGTFVCPFAWGQDDDSADAELDFGGGVWKPSLKISGLYTDNFYNEDVGTQSAYGTLINPELGYTTEAGRISLNASVDGEYGTFDVPGSADDYLDAQVKSLLTWNAGTRNRFDLSGGLRHDHDDFGVDRTEDLTVRGVDLDRWNLASGGLRYRFGANGAAVNAELGVFGLKKHYITNRAATQVLDYDSVGADYVLSYHYSPKSSVLIDFTRADVEFDTPIGTAENRDGVTYRARLGARWQATAKTSGDVRVGVRRRTFNDGTQALEGLDWQASIQWAARPKTLFDLRTLRSEQESYSAGARVIDLKTVGLAWTQTFTARLRSILDLNTTRATFVGDNRRDDIYGSALGLDYRLRSYLLVQARAEYLMRDSSAGTAKEYDRINSYIGFRLSR